MVSKIKKSKKNLIKKIQLKNLRKFKKLIFFFLIKK